MDEITRDDVRHIWLDFQPMGAFQKDPMIVVEAEGVRVTTDDGRTYLDAIGGAIVNTLGYGEPRMRDAIRRAADGLDFWPVLHSTTPVAVRLAKRLAELLPGDLDSVFLLCGGSEATETAMKMARQFHKQNGEGGRYKVISRYWSYHGATLGALSASGVSDRRRFEPLDGGFIHVTPPNCYRCPFGKTPDVCDVECTDPIEDVVRYEGRETISALIVDPVMMAAGVLAPPKAYFTRLRTLCDDIGALLIFDEVATGFGRTGSLFAADHYDTTPDLICLGKGLSSGYAPVAAVAARSHIASSFHDDPANTFLHGHTYGGYPLGCEVALEAISILIEDGLVRRAEEIGDYLGRQLEGLAERHPEIGDVRGIGVLRGIEFVKDRQTKAPFDRHEPFARWVREAAFERGLLTRGSNHVVILSPALVISKEEVNEVIQLLDESVVAARERQSVS